MTIQLLSALDGKTYVLITTEPFSAGGPGGEVIKKLVDTMKSHFKPKLLVIAKRFHFHHRYQGPGESIADYVVELQCLGSKFEFGANLEEAFHTGLSVGCKKKLYKSSY